MRIPKGVIIAMIIMMMTPLFVGCFLVVTHDHGEDEGMATYKEEDFMISSSSRVVPCCLSGVRVRPSFRPSKNATEMWFMYTYISFTMGANPGG